MTDVKKYRPKGRGLASNSQSHKLIILILSAVVVIEGVFLAMFIAGRRPAKPAKVSVPAQIIKGKIAIVLDDWGYNQNNLEALSRIKYPLTLAILPGLPYSGRAAEKARKLGFEAILHLPLEPHENLRLEKNTITTAMSNQEIMRNLDAHLNSLPRIKGVSNHMGSKATEDKRVMGIILKELRKRRLYYLDSLTTSNTVCADLAGSLGVKVAQRDIFLDNQEESQYIKSQLNKLKAKARFYGQAIGIGHDRKAMMQVLTEVMPELKKEGYKFVFVSELVQ